MKRPGRQTKKSPVTRGLGRGLVIAGALAAALIIGVVGRTFYGGHGQGDLGQAAIGGPFTMTDQFGKTVTEKDFLGKLELIYFGYTYCPDVCPTELAAIGNALDLLGPQAAQVTPIFVTIDPERDSLDMLKDYVGNFGQGFVALSGTPAQVATMAKAFRVYYAKAKETPDKTDYLMDHSAYVYLMGRDGKYLAHFRPNTPPEEIAAKIKTYL